MEAFSCLVLLGEPGESWAEQWVHSGQTAACADLVARLRSLAEVGSITIMTPDVKPLAGLRDHSVELVESPAEGFNFGGTFVSWAEAQSGGPLAYFGGASAPLMSAGDFHQAFEALNGEDGPQAVVNNRHSTDWAILKNLGAAREFLWNLESDNPLGWGLENQLGWLVADLPASSESRTDIDTPWDLLMLYGHPKMGEELSIWLTGADPRLLSRVLKMQEVMAAPANHLMVIGRSSATAWQQLERRTQLWTRMLAEERGMLASGRFRRGQVKSLVADYIELRGVESFIKRAADWADGMLWDTRVWLAAGGGWPERGERFAADLGRKDEVKDDRLSRLIQALESAEIPIICGGHGVVSGGLLAILDSLGGAAHQPSR